MGIGFGLVFTLAVVGAGIWLWVKGTQERNKVMTIVGSFLALFLVGLIITLITTANWDSSTSSKHIHPPASQGMFEDGESEDSEIPYKSEVKEFANDVKEVAEETAEDIKKKIAALEANEK